MAEAVMPERSSEPVSKVEEPLPSFERQKAVHGGRFMMGYAVVIVMVGAALVTLGRFTLLRCGDRGPRGVTDGSEKSHGEEKQEQHRDHLHQCLRPLRTPSGDQPRAARYRVRSTSRLV